MNDLQKAYVDGISMAYKNLANKIDQMIKDAPKELYDTAILFEPFARACESKSKEIYCEIERMEVSRN